MLLFCADPLLARWRRLPALELLRLLLGDSTLEAARPILASCVVICAGSQEGTADALGVTGGFMMLDSMSSKSSTTWNK